MHGGSQPIGPVPSHLCLAVPISSAGGRYSVRVKATLVSGAASACRLLDSPIAQYLLLSCAEAAAEARVTSLEVVTSVISALPGAAASGGRLQRRAFVWCVWDYCALKYASAGCRDKPTPFHGGEIVSSLKAVK